MKKVLLIFMLSVLFMSCGVPKPQKDFETVMNALKSGDAEKIKKLNPNSNITKGDKGTEIFLNAYKKMSYTIKSTKVEGDNATINLDIKAPDLSSYIPEFLQQAMALAFANYGKSNEEISKIGDEFVVKFFEEKLNSKDLKYSQKNVNAILKKNGNDWEIDGENPKNKEFIDIISLGFTKFSENMNGNNAGKPQENKKASITELIKTEKVEFTVLSKEVSKKVSDSEYIYYEPNSKENSFLILTVKIKNISNSMIKIDSGGFQLFQNEKQYSPTMVSLKDAMNFEDINPGTEITKKIFYDVPDDVANSTGLVLKTVNNIFSETGEAEISLK